MFNKKPADIWALLTTIAVLSYITFGAGYEIIQGLKTHHVKASVPFIALSALIFICRIGYAKKSGATGTIIADYYGAAVLLLLLIIKVF